MRILRAADYRRMPWKNGGGSTIEVAIAPADATLDRFDWRISMAHVAAPGPFSKFPGIDRTLAVIDGAGIHLTIAGTPVILDRGAPPFFFPGDIETSATLIAGPIDDLNVMSSRARYRHRMTRHAAHETILVPADADHIVVMPRGGNADYIAGERSTTIANGDTLILDRTDIEAAKAATLRMQAGDAAAVFYLIALSRSAR